MEGYKPSCHRGSKQELQQALQAPAQLTVGERTAREMDRLQETMEEETSILLQMKTSPNMVCRHSENVATGADALKSQQS